MDNAIQTVNNNSLDVENIALKIAREAPELKDLNKEQLGQIAKIVITQRLTDELNRKANIANVDYRMEKEIFLMVSSRTGSEYTQSSYKRALNILEKYAKRNNINILLMDYAQADNFINSLGGSPNSKRLIIAGISSFYSYMERRNASIHNPIRGTKLRPVSKAVKDIEIPDDEDLNTIINELPELEKTAVYIMAYRGLRVGALNGLKIKGNTFQSCSKGKAIYGRFSDDIMRELDNKMPFAGYTTTTLKVRVYRAVKKLYDEGKIKATYSAHDFRHYYAVSQYRQDKDIYKLSKLLNHSNIAITETYLKSLRIEV
jgi:site-specific recombinase XerD